MLARGASDGVLVEAAAANQAEWLARVAVAAGGRAHREQGVTWTSSPAGAVLAFPRLTSGELTDLLPRFLEAARSAPEASCWSLLPTEPPDLDDVLRAAGFREGWQAHWMAAEIGQEAAARAPHGIVVEVTRDWEPTDLPWDGAGVARVRERLGAERPRRVWHVAARRDGVAVGHATLNVTDGPLGVAGIYDMGVAETERRRGVGRALTQAVLALGRETGCELATLNATPEGELLYRELAFRSVGVAQTWWR